MDRAMIRSVFLILLLMAGCAASGEPEEPIIIPPVPVAIPIIKSAVKESPTSATLTSKAILVAAAQAKTDATGYVAWKKSRPENIERLTTLTLNLDTAVRKMQAGKDKGHYVAGDVAAAREALKDLQGFLQNKGD